MRINKKMVKVLETLGYPKREMSGKRNRKTFKKAYSNRAKLKIYILKYKA